MPGLFRGESTNDEGKKNTAPFNAKKKTIFLSISFLSSHAPTQDNTGLVLQAPPGAGKTTTLPLAMLLSDPEWMRGGGRIVLLEPRRLAARAAATRMAAILNEPVGETVGYRVRFDSKVSQRTRIEVVTEGVLVQRLQRDPSLEGVAAVGSGRGGEGGGGLPLTSTPCTHHNHT